VIGSSSAFAKITCARQGGLLSVYEDGILRFLQDAGDLGIGQITSAAQFTPVGVRVIQSPGKSVDMRIKGISVRELKEAAGTPSFCPATGNFYLYV